MTPSVTDLHATLGGLWGSRDPDEELLHLARKGVVGSPYLLIDGN